MYILRVPIPTTEDISCMGNLKCHNSPICMRDSPLHSRLSEPFGLLTLQVIIINIGKTNGERVFQQIWCRLQAIGQYPSQWLKSIKLCHHHHQWSECVTVLVLCPQQTLCSSLSLTTLLFKWGSEVWEKPAQMSGCKPVMEWHSFYRETATLYRAFALPFTMLQAIIFWDGGVTVTVKMPKWPNCLRLQWSVYLSSEKRFHMWTLL